MTPEQLPWIVAGILAIAFLYSSVGHAGASGYIAVMSLAGLSPAFIKPTALTLNILVAILGTWHFWRAGHFRWDLFWPFALFSVPLATVGGYLTLPPKAFMVLVGIVLLASAVRFLVDPKEPAETHPPSRPVALGVGGALGLLAGLTGTGGGVFLTPLLIFMKWTPTKTASAISVMYILFNSIAGLTGHIMKTHKPPTFVVPLVIAALVGGAAGSYLGSRHFSPILIKRLLAAVLIIAGLKLIGLDPTTYGLKAVPPAANSAAPAGPSGPAASSSSPR
jgi:uncharacterized membrane protein YfcA